MDEIEAEIGPFLLSSSPYVWNQRSSSNRTSHGGQPSLSAMGFPDASITTEHLLTASVTLLAFGFLLPAAFRRDSSLRPVGKYMAYTTGMAVTFCALSGVLALNGERGASATFLAISLIVFALLAYFQSRFHMAVDSAEKMAKAIAEAMGEAMQKGLAKAFDDSRADNNRKP